MESYQGHSDDEIPDIFVSIRKPCRYLYPTTSKMGFSGTQIRSCQIHQSEK